MAGNDKGVLQDESSCLCDVLHEARNSREMIRIKSIANVETILEPRRNPFASIKPDRNFVSDDTAPLIYKNYYLAIVKGKF